MKIKDIRLIPLVGATPDGGWPEGDGEDDNLHTLVEVISDEGVVGLGSIFTSAKLSEGALGVLRPMLIGESAIEPVRVCEKLHQTTFWQGRGRINHTFYFRHRHRALGHLWQSHPTTHQPPARRPLPRQDQTLRFTNHARAGCFPGTPGSRRRTRFPGH